MPQITLFQWNKIRSINLKNLFILRCGFISHNVTLFIKLTITFSFFFFLLSDRNTYITAINKKCTCWQISTGISLKKSRKSENVWSQQLMRSISEKSGARWQVWQARLSQSSRPWVKYRWRDWMCSWRHELRQKEKVMSSPLVGSF